LYGIRRNINGFNIIPINERMPGETEEEHEARIDAWLAEFDEIASESHFNVVANIEQETKERTEQIWQAAKS
jgi:formiminotetrahydrofolate cyclodeaminase